MSNADMSKYDDALDEKTLQLLSEAPAVQECPAQRMRGLHEQVMRRVDDDIDEPPHAFITVRGDDKGWVELAPGIRKKLLSANPNTGAESYLLKAEPGAQAPGHAHQLDEHCLVLEGEVSYGSGLHLRAGDYHFAPAGSEHSSQHTGPGVLVYIQTVPAGAPAPF